LTFVREHFGQDTIRAHEQQANGSYRGGNEGNRSD
jgi:hypothetical protein